MTNEAILEGVLRALGELKDIRAYGVNRSLAFPAPGEGDVDIFLFCDELPSTEARRTAMEKAGGCDEIQPDVFHGERWGHGDRVIIGGVEVYLMTFTKAQAEKQADDLLGGGWTLRAQDGYYDMGRLAMLSTLVPLLDKDGWLTALQERLRHYPEALRRCVMENAMGGLRDREEINHAAQRLEPLFYHYALDGQLDFFLQGLFALNGVYFPSRKRTLRYAAGFAKKPRELDARLLEVLRLGGAAETLPQSYAKWLDVSNELCALLEDELKG